jgi:hypothetical protein
LLSELEAGEEVEVLWPLWSNSSLVEVGQVAEVLCLFLVYVGVEQVGEVHVCRTVAMELL